MLEQDYSFKQSKITKVIQTMEHYSALKINELLSYEKA